MPWQQLFPVNQGGGRRTGTPSAKLYEAGQFVINHGAARLLGEPGKVLVHVNVEERRLRLIPTTPENRGGFTLSGGGNANYRIGLRQVASEYPEMIGEYQALRIAGGIECRQKERHEDD